MKLSMLAVVMFTSAWQGATSHVPEARPASPPTACVALTLPSVQGIDGTATTFAAGVRDLFASFLTGPSIKTIKLDSRLPSQAALEAREKGCGQILLATVTRRRPMSVKFGSLFGRTAGIAASRAPIGGGVTGAIASSATAAVGEAIYSLSSQTRAKDEIELTYRLAAPDAIESAKPVVSKAKAKTDGEDLLTGLVEGAANGIVATAAGHQ